MSTYQVIKKFYQNSFCN